MDKRYDNLEEAMCKELEKLNKKYGSETSELSMQDLEKADKLYHALKSSETYYAMKEQGGSGMNGMSGRSYNSYAYEVPMSYGRGRDSMGRFTSRDDGFSGHYPMYPVSYDMRY